MSIEALKLAAASNSWAAILPELVLTCVALVLLVLEILLPKKQHGCIPIVAGLGFVGVLVALLAFQSPWLDRDTFNGLLHHSSSGQLMRAFFALAGLLVCVLGGVSLAKQSMPRVEFYHIVLIVTAAMMLLAQSNHFVLFFVALETLTIGLYILVSYFRGNPLTLEAGILRVADALDMAKGRSRIPFERGSVSIHSLSAAAVDEVRIGDGQSRPVMVEIVMNNSSGIYQVDGLLKSKLRGSGLEPYVEVVAHIDTEAEKRLVPLYRLET